MILNSVENLEDIILDWMDVCTINYADNINNFIRDHNHCEQDIDLKLELCPNFKACNQFLKKIHKDYYNGRCLDCDITFGKNLEFVNENNECPICLDNKINCVRMPNCTHIVCLQCFKKCFNAYDGSGDGENMVRRPHTHEIFFLRTNEQEQRLNLQKCPLCRS